MRSEIATETPWLSLPPQHWPTATAPPWSTRSNSRSSKSTPSFSGISKKDNAQLELHQSHVRQEFVSGAFTSLCRFRLGIAGLGRRAGAAFQKPRRFLTAPLMLSFIWGNRTWKGLKWIASFSSLLLLLLLMIEVFYVWSVIFGLFLFLVNFVLFDFLNMQPLWSKGWNFK